MRVLLATVGLLAIVGVAAAATTQPQTLSKSTAPVDAVTQDGGLVAWLAERGSRCNIVHVLLPDGTEDLPQPATASMTCHWDLSAGAPMLALAAASSSALWTLHESGSIPYDYVMEAQFGGREVQVDRLAHESDGTGWWLGGIAGSGTTLAYSKVEVTYVDPLGCASGGSCKKTISGGGIQVVSASGQATPLLAGVPALDLAVSSGRIAFVQATNVAKTGAPAPSRNGAIEVADAQQGTLVSQAQPDGVPLAIALAPRVLAVLVRSGNTDRISWYDADDGLEIGSVAVPRQTAPQLAASDHSVVFRVGHLIRRIGLATSRITTLARAPDASVGLSLSHGRIVWAENAGDSARIQALPLG